MSTAMLAMRSVGFVDLGGLRWCGQASYRGLTAQGYATSRLGGSKPEENCRSLSLGEHNNLT
jgi:hypothetical protein